MNPICPTDCTYNLAPVHFDLCAPEINLSEIQYIYIGKANSADFADWTAPGEWASRLSQTSVVGDDYIRKLTVIADKPAPATNFRDISAGRRFLTTKDHTLNVTIDETNAANHEFIRQLECSGQVKLWYQTASGHLFGGNSGIVTTMVLDLIANRGVGEIMTYTGTATWRSKFTEERVVSPIAGSGGGGGGSVTFDTPLTYAASTSASAASVSTTSASVDPDQKFEFAAIASPIGTPNNMEIYKGAALELVVSFPGDYLGQPFKYTDQSGVVYTNKTFINGNVTL